MILLIWAFWVALNGRLTFEIAGLGAGFALLLMLFCCAFGDWSWKQEGRLYKALPLIAGYAFVVIWEIVKANLALCRVVYGGKTDPVVRVIHTDLQTRLARMALANSITLTPGTVTLACDGSALTVHCLRPEMAEGLDQTVFEKRMLKIEEALNG